MQHANQAKYLLLAALCALSMAACSNPHENRPEAGAERPAPPSANHVSKEELTEYLDWMVEVKNQMRAAMSEAGQIVNNNMEGYDAAYERNRREQAALMAREPSKGTLNGEVIRNVIAALYDATGIYSRNDEKLENVRARYGKAHVDSILEHEALIVEKLGHNFSLNE